MNNLARTLLLLSLLLLTACATVQEEAAEADREHPTPEVPAPAAAAKPTECQWEQVRGMAELVRVEDGLGHFLFYPGAIAIQQPVAPDWHPGQEFKSILHRPTEAGCARPRLESMEPLSIP